MRFSRLYEELKFDDVFPVASPDEVADRKEQYKDIRFKEALNVKKTKLPDGTWHIHDDLLLSDEDISGSLTTLKNLNVSIVDGDFSCNGNKLTSLVGGPIKVGGWYDCAGNNLTNLKGCAKEIGSSFDCTANFLTSLDGCPSKVGGDFYAGIIFKPYTMKEARPFTKEDVLQLCEVGGLIDI